MSSSLLDVLIESLFSQRHIPNIQMHKWNPLFDKRAIEAFFDRYFPFPINCTECDHPPYSQNIIDWRFEII